MLLSVLPNVLESHHGGDVVVRCYGVLSQFLYCSGVVLVPFLLLFQESSLFFLRILDVEEGVVGTGEESAGLLVIVVRESISGVGVSSCIELGRRSRSEAPYGSVEYLPVRKGGFVHW